MRKLITAIFLLPMMATAAPYWNVVPSTTTAMATATLSGNFIMYPSSTSSTAGVSMSGNGAAIFDTNTLVVDAINHRVGIGTNSPAAVLDIAGIPRVTATNPEFDLYEGTNKVFHILAHSTGLYFSSRRNNSPIIFQTVSGGGSATNKAIINKDGNVGIDTMAPDEKLHVVGNVKIATAGNGLIFPDGTKQTSAAASTFDNANTTVRQTVLSGSVDASGYADFVAAGSGLNAEIQANTSEPITFAFANGFGAYGGADYVQQITSTITVSVPASSTTYLYVTRDSSMTITGHYTSEAPAYGYAHPTCINNKFSYLIPLAKMYVCSGGVWTSTAAVFVGQVTTDGSAVTSSTTYALRGEYEKQDTMTGSAVTATSFTHNIGVTPKIINAYAICITSEHGYSMGDITPLLSIVNGSAVTSASISSGRLTGVIMSGANGSPTTFGITSRSTGGLAAPTANNWNIIFSAKRGW